MTWMAKVSLTTILAAMGSSPVFAQTAEHPFISFGNTIEAPRGFAEMCRSDETFCTPNEDPGDPQLVTGAIRTHASARSDTGPRAESQPTPSIRSLTWSGAAAVVASMKPSVDIAVQQVPPVSELPSAEAGNVRHTVSLDADKSDAGMLRRINKMVNGRVTQRTDQQIYGRDEVWRRSGIGRHAVGDCEDLAIEKRFDLIASGFDPNRLFFAIAYQPRLGLHTVLIARTATGDMVLDSQTPWINRWDKAGYNWVSFQSMQHPMSWYAPGASREPELVSSPAAAKLS